MRPASRKGSQERRTCKRRSGQIVLLAILFSVIGSVQAETEFWVVVGSYQTLERAERGRERAFATLGETFEVRGADTTGDYVYRVLTGPYFTRGLAEDGVASARAGGLEGAWLLAQASTGPTPSGIDARLAERSGSEGRTGDYSGRYDSGLNRKDSSEAPLKSVSPVAPNAQQSADSQNARVPTLVEKAPDNYDLHKLRRD